jgi:hypothetical protein
VVVVVAMCEGPMMAVSTHGWFAPRCAAGRLKHPLREVNRTFRFNEDCMPTDGPIQPGQIVSVASLQGLQDVAPSLEAGTWVMYDIEGWAFTPTEEKDAPQASMRRFVTLAREMGFRAMLAPAAKWRDRAARLPADAFLAQVQNIVDPEQYGAKVCELNHRFTGRYFYAELTARHLSAQRMLLQYEAGRACAGGFALWGSRPEHISVLNKFLTQVEQL